MYHAQAASPIACAKRVREAPNRVLEPLLKLPSPRVWPNLRNRPFIGPFIEVKLFRSSIIGVALVLLSAAGGCGQLFSPAGKPMTQPSPISRARPGDPTGPGQIVSADTPEGCRIEKFLVPSPSMGRDIRAGVVLPPAYQLEPSCRLLLPTSLPRPPEPLFEGQEQSWPSVVSFDR